MKISATAIPDVLMIEPAVFCDERGFFFESFNQAKLDATLGCELTFVQDNHSKSAKNVLRGLHYQLPPWEQGKLVRVVVGDVFDVAVDIRPHSKTYRQWVGLVLSGANKRQLWIPPGFAHGFLALSDGAEVLYKTTQYYAPEYERSIRWDSNAIGIDWPLDGEPLLSAKDLRADGDLL